MSNITRHETSFLGKKLVLESGELAVMATNAVKLTYGETTVLATVVVGEADSSVDFFDLRVHYDPKMYAGGLIKSSKYVKRDGRPTDDAVIIRRMIDHAIRPLFPKDFALAVQVIVTVLSLDSEADAEFASLIATSAVLTSSKVPFAGPMTSIRMALKNNESVFNPIRSEFDHLDLNMLVSFSGMDRKFLAIEGEAEIVSDERLILLLQEAQEVCFDLATFIDQFSKKLNPTSEKIVYTPNVIPSDIYEEIKENYYEKLKTLFEEGRDKTSLSQLKEVLKNEAIKHFEEKFSSSQVSQVFESLEKKILQHLILDEGKRPDGRSVTEIRPLSSKVSYLPKVHGSALFTRGVTQALSVVTLGSIERALITEDMYGEAEKTFMHFYSFPPYCSGEIGKTGGAGGREIGHGMLAEKGIKAVMPDSSIFPYTVMVNTEITSSSGSTSMASACASCLALMDAGVPIKDIVAGIGVGLVTNDDFTKYQIITDIAYMEDAGGFMDFKLVGTKDGVTSIQCDIKLNGVPMELMPEIIRQSRKARLEVIEHMSSTLSAPRTEISENAPRFEIVDINPDKIGIVVGSGGKTIKEIQSKTNSIVAIEDSGRIVISGFDLEGLRNAKNWIIGLTKDVKVGEIYTGKIVKIVDFGAFMEILPGKEGLLHVSEISNEFVKDVRSVLKEGDEFEVKVISTENGKISLSKKALNK